VPLLSDQANSAPGSTAASARPSMTLASVLATTRALLSLQ
jgi:hypothetical protein